MLLLQRNLKAEQHRFTLKGTLTEIKIKHELVYVHSYRDIIILFVNCGGYVLSEIPALPTE